MGLTSSHSSLLTMTSQLQISRGLPLVPPQVDQERRGEGSTTTPISMVSECLPEFLPKKLGKEISICQMGLPLHFSLHIFPLGGEEEENSMRSAKSAGSYYRILNILIQERNIFATPHGVMSLLGSLLAKGRGTGQSLTAVAYASFHQNCLLHSRIICTVTMMMKWTKSWWFLAQNVHLFLITK
ncbi:hypothetical protein Y1Q_0008003 [Alligator mississippiensis]|uniref:Uncharacterized protein n=1 Tax=Alligator mississippiensis TaxID=8496 RepID=A0A151NFK0_ALLMI|nr:hypothetical protein Y1Q_0008003 [Alligator mississippiensis]